MVASDQAVDVSSTSMVPVLPPLTVRLRLVLPTMLPQFSTLFQSPRVYLYCMTVPSVMVTVASQMPPPLFVMATFPGSQGPSWTMLPGTYNLASGGVPAGARVRKGTATGPGVRLTAAAAVSGRPA